MRFVWRMALRELRSGWRRLAFFFLCLSVGVGAVVALRSTIQNAGAAVSADARLLLAADVIADSSREWPAEALEAFRREGPRLVEAQTETVDLPTMLRPADSSRAGALMVELKAVGPPYPLYGEFKLSGGAAFDHKLLEGNGAVAAEALLERLGLRAGDAVRVGDATFVIRGSFAEEPGASGGFRLGPRVFIARDAVAATGLVGFGSRARHRMLFRARDGQTERLAAELRAALKGTLVGVRTWRDAEESLGEQFERSENYLALTGLVILVLGGIGITNVTRVFVEQKRRTIAVLKCVGATSRRVMSAYLAQTAALGLAGSLFGILLAFVALIFVERYFAASLPPRMSFALTAGAVWQGLALGLLVTLLFSALPLLRVRNIRPNTLLRDLDGNSGPRRRRFDPAYWLTAGVVVAALVLVSSWQAASLRVGVLFLAGLLAAAGALYGSAAALIFLVRRARRIRYFALRHAVSSLHRPGNQTRTVVMAVGLGVFLVLTVRALQTNLLAEFDPAQRGRLPGMYLIDVQPDQREGVAGLIEGLTGRPAQLVPTVRARIAAVDGRAVDLDAREVRRDRGRLGREYVVTYRPALEESETIVEGELWPPTEAAEPEVSIEEGMKGLAGMGLGSRITFDVLGRKIEAKVSSVRRVDWRNARTGFLILFRPGALERAPQTFVAPVDSTADAAARARFQRTLVERYPSVAVIDVTEIVRSVSRLLDNVSLAVSFLGGFVLLSGALILTGSIAMTKWQRVYESAILKTLGAKRRDLLAVMLAEYGLLGLVAGATGAAAAAALSWAVARFVFDIDWSFAPALAAAGIAATVLLVAAVGALSSLDVLARKPLSTLRNQ